MWCTASMKNVYIQKMLDVLLERRQKHLDAINSIDRRINKLKTGWSNEN